MAQSNKAPYGLLAVCFGAVSLFALLMGGQRAEPAPTVTPVPTTRQVSYRATASGVPADVNMTNSTGGMDQDYAGIGAPLSATYTLPRGAFAYMTAQLRGRGSVTCVLSIDGAMVDTQTSNGEYQIATCKARVP